MHTRLLDNHIVCVLDIFPIFACSLGNRSNLRSARNFFITAMPHDHHEHDHDHHSHAPRIESASLGKIYLVSIIVNSLYILVEGGSGIFLNSVALLSDAGHNLVDVSTLAISYLAYRIGKLPCSPEKTYGYKKAEIVSSFGNAVLLMGIAIFLIAMGIVRLLHPIQIEGLASAVIAGIGIIINFGTAYLFVRAQRGDMNARGAYLHMLADGLVSVGVVLSGIAMYFTGAYFLDGLMGAAIGFVILVSGYPLLRQSWNGIVDGVPDSVDMEEIVETISKTRGVISYHDLHIWPLGTREVAMSVHIVAETQNIQTLAVELSETLRQSGIDHVTVQTEVSDCHFDCQSKT